MPRLVLVAGKPSHAPGAHEFRAGMRLLARCLQGVPDLHVDVHDQGSFPEMTASDTSAVVVFADGGPSHPVFEGDRAARLDALVRAGVGIGLMHYAVEPPAEYGATEVDRWIGGHYKDGVSCNPIWEAAVEPLAGHPATRGVAPFTITDEWYVNIAFEVDAPSGPGRTADGSTFSPMLIAIPSDTVRNGPYVWPVGPYAHVVAASGRRETLMWAIERPDGSRGFGLTGGHFHANWGNEEFRKVVLNSLVWVAGLPVPPSGIGSAVTPAQLELDLDAPV